MTTAIETKGKSKVSVEDVIAIRKMKVKNPDMSAQKIKDALKLKLSAIMVGRAIRGISHSHIDMCGLPIRPFNSESEAEANAAKHSTPKRLAQVAKVKAADAKAKAAKAKPVKAKPVKAMLRSPSNSAKAAKKQAAAKVTAPEQA